MKNLLCKLGFHKPDKFNYTTVTYYRKGHRGHGSKYHKNYHICARCGKRLNPFAKHRIRRLK